MVLDTSSILAILFEEAESDALIDALASEEPVAVGAPTLVETGIVLGSRLGYERLVLLHRFLQLFKVTTISFTEGHWTAAVEAYRRFGKGRHSASLNFGDCLSYASAEVSGQPLLCVGDDFVQTDLSLVAWR